jgi:electron transport complex protein RnfB
MTKPTDLGAKIDALLPQTQCGLCDYPGCKPYAQAIIEKNERIDRCLPGGVEVLEKLGELLKVDPTPYVDDMLSKQKSESRVVIREADCIGCTKCIQACPVDAIIGSAKLMHTVIADACTGCDLCISPCPVDCIEIIKIPPRNANEKMQMAESSRKRYENQNARLGRVTEKPSTPLSLDAKKVAIQDAIRRAKEKKAL